MRLNGATAIIVSTMMILFAAGAVGVEAPAGVDNPARAEFNYRMHCQGCHGPDGSGTSDGAVPTMNGFLGNFLRVDRGREFLVRVPGSANAAMSDAALAEVLNWLLPRISAQQIPSDFQPFRETEVAAWRAEPLQDVVGMRNTLIARMAELGISE
jgi:mono/diheme cytochrome c family protein